MLLIARNLLLWGVVVVVGVLALDDRQRGFDERSEEKGKRTGGGNIFGLGSNRCFGSSCDARGHDGRIIGAGPQSFDDNFPGDGGRRPKQQSSDDESKYNGSPNSGYAGQHGSRPDRFDSREEDRRPSQPTVQFGSDDYHARPHQFSGSSGQANNNQFGNRPNQQSGPFNNNNHRENEYSNKRPNQQGSFGQFNNNQENEYSNKRPNQQGSSGQFNNNNHRENEYSNKRPNQQGSSGQFNNNNRESTSKRPNQQGSSGQFNNNKRETTTKRPNQQGNSGQFNNNKRETTTTKRPNQQGSSGQFNNNRESTSKRPNQQQSNKEQQGPESSNQNPTSLWQDEDEVCYPVFGCFSMAEPWRSSLRPVPAPLHPENNSASIYFYSRPQVNQRYLINLYPEFSMGEAKFDPRKRTAIIIHGFIQDGNEEWMNAMKNAYLRRMDANVMIVDWGKGSQQLSYLQATANTRLIGRMVGALVKTLVRSHKAQTRKFHVIGHSLGGQIASYIGKEVPGIGRITALDPAQPGFEGYDPRVRLDKSDADFVDVVHTDAKPFVPLFGLGMIKPHGHVDFYMNGGFEQPLCVSPPKNDLKPVKTILDLAQLPVNFFSRTVTCSHTRAYSYLIEAFEEPDKCIFWGHKATPKNVIQTITNVFTEGFLAKYVALSGTCTKDTCIPLGFDTHKSRLRGSFVVTTSGMAPYCVSEPGIPPEEGRKKSLISGLTGN